MSATSLIRFPDRRQAVVWLLPERDNGWLVLARGFGWLCTSSGDADKEARCASHRISSSAPMTAADLAHHLGGRKSGRSWSCRCPVPEHRDRNPSFSISERDDGRILFHCFAGCSQEQVLVALRDRGLWPNGHDRDQIGYGGDLDRVPPWS